MADGLTCAATGPGLEVAANGGGFPANSGLDEPRAAEVLHLRKGGFVCLVESSVTMHRGRQEHGTRRRGTSFKNTLINTEIAGDRYTHSMTLRLDKDTGRTEDL